MRDGATGQFMVLPAATWDEVHGIWYLQYIRFILNQT